MASNDIHSDKGRDDSASADRARRVFLLAFPAAVFAAVAGALSAAAFRFLRPRGEPAGASGESHWRAVAPAASLAGAEPATRKVSITRAAGWATAAEERTVFVLPAQPRPRVVSAVCPHEGCEVSWDAGLKNFLCPCHDSRFGADGAALTGPATRGLEEFPSRVENGVLEIQYRPPAPGADSPREA
ncbi:MAG: Rieske 2Fe-2S domain-containing protein [Acidobacteria bacterium]|nr:Rieske 2Fe-2S domain-containing protein [Acidobacteriota bacterium]